MPNWLYRVEAEYLTVAGGSNASAAGVAVATGLSAQIVGVVGNAAGVAVASGAGQNANAVIIEADGLAAGVATVAAVSGATAKVTGTAAGSGVALGAGEALSPFLRYTWKVLQPADAVQAYTWTVLEVVIVGGEQRFVWRVVEDDPGQAFIWTVIPAELLELFESEGVGAAVGIASDVLLPVGRVTKD